MSVRLCLTLVSVLWFARTSTDAKAQTAPDSTSRGRAWVVSSGAAAITLGSWAALDQAWYAGYDRTTLHTFNDGAEWLGMDKAGHLWSGYNGGRWGYAMMRWARAPERHSSLMGGSMGLVFLTGVELLDGFSAGWGFSWWDMTANTAGAGLFIGQQALWREQRVSLKVSAHLTPFAAQRPTTLGEGTAERILKDYNGQTIWLSGNLHAFGAGGEGFPKWLNVAVGYGAENMLTGEESGIERLGMERRYRQLFFSLDADLTRIRSRSGFVRTALFLLNCVKIPAPALEFREGRVLAHGLYF